MAKAKIVYKKIADLVPYENNARTHSEAQTKQIAASITEFGWTNPILIDSKNGIIAGHGRALAATLLGMDEAPCISITGLTDAQKRALIIADNKLAMNASWDEDMLKIELQDLEGLDFDLSMIGFDVAELKELFSDTEENYSRKIEAPIYEVTGAKPDLRDLYDETKANSLKEKISEADLPDDIALFLSAAADRHTVFNFAKVAEYYAHAPTEIQALMEQSALVIIDFDAAIENGFVELSKGMMKQVEKIKAAQNEG